MRNLKPAYDLIKEFEGLHKKVGDKIHAYLDPIGIPTIGWGSIRHPDGRKVAMGDVITLEQAQKYLEHEVSSFVTAVEQACKVPVNDNQFCALVSFSYNVGAGALRSSTLLKRLNAGEYLAAAEEFAKWNKAGGKVLAGLTRRRKAEKDLFLSPSVEVQDQTPLDKQEAEFDADVVETPSWFEPFKAIIKSLFDAIFGSKKGSNVLPDDAETGAPAKSAELSTATLSEGSGPRITLEKCQEILKAWGCDTNQLNLLGIRGYYLDTYGVKGQNDRGVYDDALIWVWKDGFYTYKGNVDPSRVRKGSGFGSGKGMANLKVGIWKYLPGMHNGSVPHLAFRQAAEVTVIRDGNPDYPNTGWFGINIHRGGSSSTSSLGCQTLPPAVWTHFKATGDSQLARHGQKTFNYVLVNETDLRNGVLKV